MREIKTEKICFCDINFDSKCEPELSKILAILFNICSKESFSPNCKKFSPAVLLFKNIGERSEAKNLPSC